MTNNPKIEVIEDNNIFNQSFIDEIEKEDEPKKTNKKSGPIMVFLDKNKIWIIIIVIMLISVIALSLSLYFINQKCKATVIAEREKFEKNINTYNDEIKKNIADRDKYCEEAQQLRGELRMLEQENYEMKNAQQRNVELQMQNKLTQKKLLQDKLAKKNKKKVKILNENSSSEEEQENIIPKDILHKGKPSQEEKTAISLTELNNPETVITQRNDEDISEGLIEM